MEVIITITKFGYQNFKIMKKAIVLSGIVLSMFSCNSPKKEEVKEEKVNTEETQEPLVGADRDEHGCISSAGFSWSELQ